MADRVTLVEFHSDIAEPLHFACRLLRKAYGQGHAVLVTAPAEILRSLDVALWTFDAQSFIPHGRVQAAASQSDRARTPVWLAEQADQRPCPPLLVNLGAPVAAELDAFDRIVEIVGTEGQAVQAGRSRWREYVARGLQPTHRATAAGVGRGA